MQCSTKNAIDIKTQVQYNMAPKIDPDVGCVIPDQGEWPVPPQEDQDLEDSRLWIDGCFDFFHHGHTGVMLQARRLGTSLVVGIHSDEEIAANKGPTVMSLAERVAAVEACRFSTLAVPAAPYVTSLPWIEHYGCKYVVHGDDVSSDANGEDAYRFVKRANRMKIVPRTPGISTTDLVGRMLLYSKEHFVRSLTDCIQGVEGKGGEEERKREGREMGRRIKEYAAAESGRGRCVEVYTYTEPTTGDPATTPPFTSLVSGLAPRPGQRVVYVDGAFDLFSSGHISFLAQVRALEHALGVSRDWFTTSAIQARINHHGGDYPPAYVIAGIHNDAVVNEHKGMNYPIMNIFERGLCVVQCKYIHAVVFGAPYTPSASYLKSFPEGSGKAPDAVYHGPTSSSASSSQPDPYADAKALGIFRETPEHAFQDVNAAQIVRRILDKRGEYEERQRRKGAKRVGEDAAERREAMEREMQAKGLS